METELKKIDWEMFKANNIQVIKNSKIQIEAAENIIKLCDEKIKEFPEDPEEIPDSSNNPIVD